MTNRSLIQMFFLAVLSLTSVACAGIQKQEDASARLGRALEASAGYRGASAPMVQTATTPDVPQFSTPNMDLAVTNTTQNFVEPIGPFVPTRCATGPQGQPIDCSELVWVEIMRPNAMVSVWVWVIPPGGTAHYTFQDTGNVPVMYNAYVQTVPAAKAVGFYPQLCEDVGQKDCSIELRRFRSIAPSRPGAKPRRS